VQRVGDDLLSFLTKANRAPTDHGERLDGYERCYIQKNMGNNASTLDGWIWKLGAPQKNGRIFPPKGTA
jgi:hypothetical protein